MSRGGSVWLGSRCKGFRCHLGHCRGVASDAASSSIGPNSTSLLDSCRSMGVSRSVRWRVECEGGGGCVDMREEVGSVDMREEGGDIRV